MEKYINVITLGPIGVGKTSIINRIKTGKFEEKVKATVGFNTFIIKKPYQRKNLTIVLNFKDTGGEESYLSFLPMQYIRNSHVVLLVFDSIDTLNDLMNRWLKFYKDNSNIDHSRFILIGNKSDLYGEQRDIIVQEGDKFSQDIDAHFITCSAKNADNMDNLERFILTEARRFIDEEEKYLNSIKNDNNSDNNNKSNENKNFSINKENTNNNKDIKKGKCCK